MTNERVFLEAESCPTEETLKSAFGEIYSYYEKLMYIAGSFSKKWNYSKNGWTLKVFDEKKLCFI